MKTYSTSEVAALCGVNKSTLLRWLYAGELPEPSKQALGGVEVRVWTAEDLKRAQRHREQRYRKRR